jgi:hypothetical protein
MICQIDDGGPFGGTSFDDYVKTARNIWIKMFNLVRGSCKQSFPLYFIRTIIAATVVVLLFTVTSVTMSLGLVYATVMSIYGGCIALYENWKECRDQCIREEKMREENKGIN